MENNELIELKRDCDASLIPSGDPITLNKGEMVRITQSLGGSYTVLINGNLARIEGSDADAIGIKTVDKNDDLNIEINDENIEPMVWDALKNCFDPEIPVNIVDLGLVYDCTIKKQKNNDYHVSIKMTLTAPGCGMAGHISNDARVKVANLRGISDVEVDIVWEPQWNQSMMTDDAKLQLGMM
jgi:probable FeS assembly SUF system protein SufT